MTTGVNPHPGITSALIGDVRQDSGEWVFVDIGFAKQGKKTSGIAIGDGQPDEVEFASLAPLIIKEMCHGSRPLNLLIEAPLSVAFDAKGNPVGRCIEKRGRATRYWYVGPGCAVLTAATYLLRQLNETVPARQVRLVEGFASFKSGAPRKRSHAEDVCKLRDRAWNRAGTKGRVVGPENLRAKRGDCLVSAFKVSGMDFGVPPVVVL